MPNNVMVQPETGFLQSYISENPEALYRNYINRLSPELKRYYQYNYDKVYADYMASLVQQARSGVMPKGDFGGFLQNYAFNPKYRSMMPNERGYYSANYAPRTRFLNY